MTLVQMGLGLLVAENIEVAKRGSRLVQISYTNIQEPVLTIRDALKDPERIESAGDPIQEGDVEKELEGSKQTVTGEFEIGSQYPFHLETQICISVPKYNYSRFKHIFVSNMYTQTLFQAI